MWWRTSMPVPSVEECLLPVLKALARDVETPATEIRKRVAAELNLTTSELQEPGPRPGYSKFKNNVAFAFVRLRSGGGGYGLLKGKRGAYRLTADGADLLAGRPTTLTFDQLKKNYPVKARSTTPRTSTARTSADSAFDLRSAWELAGQRIAENEEAPQRIADRAAMLEEVKAWPDSDRSSREFIAKRIGWCLIGRQDDRSLEMVQFHQSYAYEDFVQGFRPTKKGGFSRRNGVFFDFCRRAGREPETPYVFIVDEINRGNLSRIFGELLMLIEADKRGQEHSVRLTYQNEGESFSVPGNVHILGLMNTADRSLAMVDYALRRRFAFEELEPQFNKKFRRHLRGKGAGKSLINRIASEMTELNERIRDDEDLGHGFEIGHSYFVPNGKEQADENWRRHQVRSQIMPLLREYWFDRKDEVVTWEKRLLESPDGD